DIGSVAAWDNYSAATSKGTTLYIQTEVENSPLQQLMGKFVMSPTGTATLYATGGSSVLPLVNSDARVALNDAARANPVAAEVGEGIGIAAGLASGGTSIFELGGVRAAETGASEYGVAFF